MNTATATPKTSKAKPATEAAKTPLAQPEENAAAAVSSEITAAEGLSDESPAIMVDADGKPVVEVSQFLALLNQGGEMAAFDIMDLPDLDQEGVVVPLSLVEDYWTPESKGETRKLAFLGVKTIMIPSMSEENRGELVERTYAEFAERQPDGSGKIVTSAAARLVGFFTDRDVPRGTFWQITYTGKVQNKTNAYKSDSFAIQMIVLPGAARRKSTAAADKAEQ